MLVGESILTSQTTKEVITKRKHISVAFYKDRMNQNLKNIISMTFNQVESWKKQISDEGSLEFDLVQTMNNLLMNCIQACVFGLKELDHTLEYTSNGRVELIGVGTFLKKHFRSITLRNLKTLRMNFPILDQFYIGKEEKEIYHNNEVFRSFILKMI